MRRHPLLLELNARLWLRRLTAQHGRPLTFGSLPDHLVKQSVAGYDSVWVMGVWARTAGSRQQGLASPGLTSEFRRVLPDWSPSDAAGSPYAVGSYSLDPALGPVHGLADLGAQLSAMGRALIVDFVPNHLALDHAWTLTHPERFIQGGVADVERDANAFFKTSQGLVLAHGKDPYFPAWQDTVQVNIFHAGLRQALIDVLMGIASVADGVRCDMAMLLLNNIFQRTWAGSLRGVQPPTTEFWEEAITKVKSRYPNFVFIAEAYWGTEGRLVELGFDYTYDKTFYDRLVHSDVEGLRAHLQGMGDFTQRGVRFIENHDEPRAAATFGRERLEAAAVAASTLPGMRLFHEGQDEGRHHRLPVQLVREPQAAADETVRAFHRRLLELCASPALQRGRWSLLQVDSAPYDGGPTCPLAWAWWLNDIPTIVILNPSDKHAAGRLRFAGPLPSRVQFTDPFGRHEQVEASAEVETTGLRVDLPPWQARVLCGLPA